MRLGIARRSRVGLSRLIPLVHDAAEYLRLLSELPAAYAGDVLLIENDSAFVSATGRGGDRVLYALRPEDVQFYLETKMLTAPAESMAA